MFAPRTLDEAGLLLPSPTSFANLQCISRVEQLWNQSLMNSPGRVYIREGILLKVCRKTDQSRAVILFNDALLYAQIAPTPASVGGATTASPRASRKYHNQHILPIADLIVKPSGRREFAIEIRTSSKSFIVIAPDAFDYQDWLAKLVHYTDSANKTVKPAALAPVWVPDSAVALCQLCANVRFTMFNRRHHCRYCGRCVCGACADKTWLLPNISRSPVRVCRECFECLTNGLPPKFQSSEHDHNTVPLSHNSFLVRTSTGSLNSPVGTEPTTSPESEDIALDSSDDEELAIKDNPFYDEADADHQSAEGGASIIENAENPFIINTTPMNPFHDTTSSSS